jgi:hypothetical protein
MSTRTDKERLDWLERNSYAFAFRHDTGKGFIRLSAAYRHMGPFNLRGAVDEAIDYVAVEYTKCPRCGGTGFVGPYPNDYCCSDCEGSGRIEEDPESEALKACTLERTRGQHLRDQGKSQVALHNAEWLHWIRREAERIAKFRGLVAVDELRWYADQHHRQPYHPNAWGTVFSEDHWVPCG